MANFSCVARCLLATGAAIAVLAVPSVTALPAASAEPVAAAADPCPYRVTTPPAVDASEVPKPGEAAPAPLPVPAKPVGGDALGGCGVIVAPNTPPPPIDVSAEAWLVADLDSGDVIAAKDPHGRHRPASVIKVLTAMAAINELPLNRQVPGTEEDSRVEGTKVGVGPGGLYTVRDLLHGLVMYSGNDAANALAVQFGNLDAGMQKINSLAAKLGAGDTRAATPSGLDGPGMSTSAYDIGLLYRYAWQNPTFTEITATREFNFPGRDGNPPYEIVNDNQLLMNYPGALGGKTGYTDDAGQTFVGAADRDGRRLVAVLLKGTRQPIPPWQQAAHLLDYGFATPPGTKVGSLVDPDPSLQRKINASGDTDITAAPVLSPQDAMAVRVGVAVIGTIIVLGLIMAARSMNRRSPL